MKSDNLSGAAIMVVAVGSFALMDACLKVLSPHYGAMQVATVRGLATLPVAVVWAAVQGGLDQLWRVRFGLHAVRGVLGIVSLATFAYALRSLPLSEAYAIFFVAPLLITAFAAPLLGERVGRRRWIAIAIGFAGALIVLRPTGTGAFTVAGLAVLVCATGYAFSAITVRVLGRTDSTPSMVFWVMAMVAAGAGAMALPGWRPIQSVHWPVIGGIAIAGSVGQWALTEAFRRGQASFIAPFEYTALVWGLGLDWALWRTLPAAITVVGAGVIVTSGVYLVRHEPVHAEAEHP
ncbi:MAG: DMT family transporter [Gemmatimonadales bacterium]